MTTCYIAFGSNLGDRKKTIDAALEKLRNCAGIEVSRVSSIIETDPVGGPPQGKFLNGVAEVHTDLAPRELLECLQKIESELGRVRSEKNAPRTIDLDILLYGDEKIDEPGLKVPHPRMHEREFVMKPLKELT